MFRLALVGLFCVSSIFSSEVFAQAKKGDKNFAILDIKQVDEDFHFQGEYYGLIGTDCSWCGSCTIGLQVVARGDGNFVASLYYGGLPGNGWDRSERRELTGMRKGDVLTLKGEELLLQVKKGGRVDVRDLAGHLLGQISKYQRTSVTLGAKPPVDATVLFDGSSVDQFKDGKITDEGLLNVGTEFKKTYHSFRLHLEFRLPYMPYATGQARSNSGVYLQSRYEVQVLDSFGLEGVENECGGLYKQKRADVNMCFPPLSWQTYDIAFVAPRFDSAGKKTKNAFITVLQNGIPIHQDYSIIAKTGGGKQEGAELFPIKLQNHSNPVRFRNIWIVDLSDQPDPVYCHPCQSLLCDR
ncbi:DUF1080 domain-containing protein [uncultured Gimesia sp.]|uniref:3-keto-disaccharide hydrolase n=1 Tax=uncultured Gimesia sp. TaxID=1678688 RepID=UPI002633089F|nr:DUF1080 domain-containing protein [uncultured Gimesia sp.]